MKIKIIVKVMLITTLLMFTGCSSLIEKAKKFEAKDMAKRAAIKKDIEDGYLRLESYKADTGYKGYEITRKDNIFYKIGEKYTGVGVSEVTKQKIVFYGNAKEQCKIFEDEKVAWKLKYKLDGFRNTIDAVNNFKFEVENAETQKEIKTEIGELTQIRQENSYIPDINSIEYNEEKINFEIINYFIDTRVITVPVWGPKTEKIYYISEYKNVTGRNPDVIYEIKIFKNGEEIAKLVLRDTIDYSEKIFIGKKLEDNNSILYIKNGIDEDLKSFLFKSALMLKLHKEMRYSIQKEFN